MPDEFDRALTQQRAKVKKRDNSLFSAKSEVNDQNRSGDNKANMPALPKAAESKKQIVMRLPASLVVEIDRELLGRNLSREALFEALLQSFLEGGKANIIKTAEAIQQSRTKARELKRAKTLAEAHELI